MRANVDRNRSQRKRSGDVAGGYSGETKAAPAAGHAIKAPPRDAPRPPANPAGAALEIATPGVRPRGATRRRKRQSSSDEAPRREGHSRPWIDRAMRAG